MFQKANVLPFAQLGIQLEWRGEAENEVGIVKLINKDKLHTIIQPVSAKRSGDGSSNLFYPNHPFMSERSGDPDLSGQSICFIKLSNQQLTAIGRKINKTDYSKLTVDNKPL
jgi:hypothetical protein